MGTASSRSAITERCHARVGLMGNPSDGFEGKTLSFLIGNFAAVVTVEENGGNSGMEIVRNPRLDPLCFEDVGAFVEHTRANGYYGGMRLVQAACMVFATRCVQAGHGAVLTSRGGFRISYDTDIPRCVGLSGSSALIIATFRALMRFYTLDLAALQILPSELPTLMLDVERKELGISAGLQDRVIQVFGGLVHMDFSGGPTGPLGLTGGVYSPVDPALLPPLYLAYNTRVGGDSGTVHSTVKERWARRDPELVAGMQALGGYADEALGALQRGDAHALASLMDRNFSMRRALYGDVIVGEKNILMVQMAQGMGLAAKFTGSGGALVCMRQDGLGWLEQAREEAVRAAFSEQGFVLVRVQLPPPPAPVS